ncbi:tRNA U-34 5-methylaminomethyl-2-thiouridine biosynthesis protein [Falsibacillus albus]|uniref:tRNA U-34 5-methylaminomethyl-2-thiouridine biosynthesis protein n=1 Tax=Falsibacillus albus TaxID=2478915 RepID=UPI0011E5DDEB|nr:tRNA U-34 5-methylaminomethyl-2-thiouridine biosynthesis protein [Falsibacillus albus]
MTKNLLMLFLGAFVSWLAISLVSHNFGVTSLFVFFLWSSIGYGVGKKDVKH